jgi:hypothetical protein
MAQHQPAVRPLGILGALAQKTLNTLLEGTERERERELFIP